jgi:hypothetical protein
MNKRVRVYYNLHKKKLSVLHKTKKGWRLREHRDSIKLKDARFIIYEAGRQRVLKEKRKNVHAYIEGTERHSPLPSLFYKARPVKYNPYYMSQFMTMDFKPLFESKFCYIDCKSDNKILV